MSERNLCFAPFSAALKQVKNDADDTFHGGAHWRETALIDMRQAMGCDKCKRFSNSVLDEKRMSLDRRGAPGQRFLAPILTILRPLVAMRP